MIYPVPPVAVEVSMDYGGLLYAGTNLTLTCSIDLDENLVDIPVIVKTSWMKNNVLAITDSTHSEQQPIALNGTLLTFDATYSFTPLDDKFNSTESSDMGDSGVYQCQVTVTPDITNYFVRTRNSSNASNDITVLGELDVVSYYKSS